MSPAAIIATAMQYRAALDVVENGPADPSYEWAARFVIVNLKDVLKATREPIRAVPRQPTPDAGYGDARSVGSSGDPTDASELRPTGRRPGSGH
jgi:hypothetical protein